MTVNCSDTSLRAECVFITLDMLSMCKRALHETNAGMLAAVEGLSLQSLLCQGTIG